jgi:flagellin
MTYFAQVGTRLSAQRGIVGAFLSRAQSSLGTLSRSSEEYTAAQSRIVDADVAKESASLTKNRILEEVCVSIMAQANTIPALALTLLRAA